MKREIASSYTVVLGWLISLVIAHRPMVKTLATPIAGESEILCLPATHIIWLIALAIARPPHRPMVKTPVLPIAGDREILCLPATHMIWLTASLAVRAFERAIERAKSLHSSAYNVPFPGAADRAGFRPEEPLEECPACQGFHATGSCPLKIAGVEYCMLCGLPHYGHSRVCAHINSVTQLRLMVDALKHSPEQADLVAEAKRRVVGIIGSINQHKRRKEQQRAGAGQTGAPALQQPRMDPGQPMAPAAGLIHPSVSLGGPIPGTFQTH